MITFFPADGQFPPSTIKQFVALMDEADMVLGYLPSRKRSLLAKGLSFSERVLYTCLFGKLPRFQGVLMWRHNAVTPTYISRRCGRPSNNYLRLHE